MFHPLPLFSNPSLSLLWRLSNHHEFFALSTLYSYALYAPYLNMHLIWVTQTFCYMHFMHLILICTLYFICTVNIFCIFGIPTCWNNSIRSFISNILNLVKYLTFCNMRLVSQQCYTRPISATTTYLQLFWLRSFQCIGKRLSLCIYMSHTCHSFSPHFPPPSLVP